MGDALSNYAVNASVLPSRRLHRRKRRARSPRALCVALGVPEQQPIEKPERLRTSSSEVASRGGRSLLH